MAERYSDTLMEHFFEPYHRGTLTQPDGVGISGTPGQGPFFIFQIACYQDCVREAWFQCHNCGVTVACGSVLAKISENQSLAACETIDEEELLQQLDGVPSDKRHMLQFVLLAFKGALEEARRDIT